MASICGSSPSWNVTARNKAHPLRSPAGLCKSRPHPERLRWVCFHVGQGPFYGDRALSTHSRAAGFSLDATLSRLINAALSVLDRQRYKVVLVGQGLVPRLAQQLRHLTMLLGRLPKGHAIPPLIRSRHCSSARRISPAPPRGSKTSRSDCAEPVTCTPAAP